MQGIISGLELPPISKAATPAAAERMRRYMRQSVTLTGLGATSFSALVDKMDQIHMMFLNHLPPGSLNESSPSYYRDKPVITTHNRYFTPAHLVPNQPRIEFSHQVDPERHLQGLSNQAFAHIKDNKVEYFGIPSKDGRIVSAGPNMFRCGDIVKLSIEFCAFPAGSKKHTLVPVLRGIRMINAEFRLKAGIMRMHACRSTHAQAVARVPKHKAIYTEEELENTRQFLQKLRMDTQ